MRTVYVKHSNSAKESEKSIGLRDAARVHRKVRLIDVDAQPIVEAPGKTAP